MEYCKRMDWNKLAVKDVSCKAPAKKGSMYCEEHTAEALAVSREKRKCKGKGCEKLVSGNLKFCWRCRTGMGRPTNAERYTRGAK